MPLSRKQATIPHNGTKDAFRYQIDNKATLDIKITATYLQENNTCDEVGIEIVYAVTALKGDDDSLENVLAYTADINCKSIRGLSDSSIVASKG